MSRVKNSRIHKDTAFHRVQSAGDNVLRSTAHGILVVVHGTDDVLRTVKLFIGLVPALKRNLFSTLGTAQKSVKTIIEKSASSLDLPFSVQ